MAPSCSCCSVVRAIQEGQECKEHTLLGQFKGILHLSFLNKEEKDVLGEMVKERMEDFLKTGQFDLNGNLFVEKKIEENRLYDISEKEAVEDNNTEGIKNKDHNTSNKEISTGAEKNQITNYEDLETIQDILLADFSDEEDEDEDADESGNVQEMPTAMTDVENYTIEGNAEEEENTQDAQNVNKLTAALSQCKPVRVSINRNDFRTWLNDNEEMDKDETGGEDDKDHNTSKYCRLCYTDLKDTSFLEHNLDIHKDDQDALQMEFSADKLVHNCHICPLRFLTENLLNTHKKEAHRIGVKEPVKKNKCDICYKDISGHMPSHLATHGDKKYECKLCYAKFTLNSYLKHHKIKVHKNEMELFNQNIASEDLIFLCNKNGCNKRFARVGILKYHEVYGHVANSFNCTNCDQKFPVRRQLKIHMKLSHSRPNAAAEKLFKCKLCYTTFSKSVNMRCHKKVHKEDLEWFNIEIGDVDLKFECQETKCSKRFVSPILLKYHTNRIHKELEFKHLKDSKTKVHACPLCFLEFQSFYAMHNHILDIHHEDKDLIRKGANQETPNINCTLCELKFARSSILLYHKGRVHKVGNAHKRKKLSAKKNQIQQKVTCQLCYTRFSSRGNFKVHIKKVHHTEEEKSALQMDIIDNDILTYQCQQCEKKFLNENILNRHGRLQHKEKSVGLVIVKTTRQNYCKLCYLKFERPCIFEKHKILLHRDEMHAFNVKIEETQLKFNCDQCGRKYLTDNILNFHMKRKHKQLKHKEDITCKYCNKVFFWSRDIKRKLGTHMLNVHAISNYNNDGVVTTDEDQSVTNFQTILNVLNKRK